MLINAVVQESDRKIIKPIQTFASQQSNISFGTPIFFTHGFQNFNHLTQVPILQAILVCTQAQYGYQIGDTVTPGRELTLQPTNTQIVARPAGNGVYIVRADSGRWGKINALRWDLIVKALLI